MNNGPDNTKPTENYIDCNGSQTSLPPTWWTEPFDEWKRTINSTNQTQCFGDRSVSVGDVFTHFKERKMYLVVGFATDTETEDILVLYRPIVFLPEDDKIWAISISMFLGKVDRNKYPEAKQEYRFEYLGCHKDFK